MKKNVPKGRLFPVRVLLKTLLVMKLALAIMLISAFQVQAGNASGQNISLNLKNTDVKGVLTSIEKSTRYRFLYNYDLSGLKAKLDFKAEEASLNEVLSKLLNGNNLTYKKLNRNLIAIVSTLPSEQNQTTVTGKITNDKSAVVAGATITEKGTTNATVSNENGEYSITVADGAVLEISAVGYQSQDIVVGERTVVDITLVTAISSLDEVIVIGYGTQRRSNVTGAISSVKSKDIENIPSGRVEQALQGRASGVTIMQNSGQPGSASTIRVRGVTTFGEGGNNPLWVVDGMVVDAGAMGYLNQDDIESIEVLKDASSAAIYGTRAATGVILVTTKKGKSGKPVIRYNGSYGISSAAKKVNLVNANEYATLLNELNTNAGTDPIFDNPSQYGEGTDWQDVIFNNSAKRYSHELSLSGGNDISTYYISAGILNQQGIVMTDISNYNRKNLRINSTHKISKIFTFGESVGYSHQKTTGIGNTNNEFGGPLASAINIEPTLPVIITDPNVLNQAPYTDSRIIRDAAGNPYGIPSLVPNEMANPLAYAQTRLGQFNWSDDIIGNAYLEASITKDLKVKTSLGGKLSYWGFDGFTPVYLLNAVSSSAQNNYRLEDNKGFGWNIENTINYNKTIGDHNFSVLLGQGAYVDNIGHKLSLTLYNLPITSYKDASAKFDIPQEDRVTDKDQFIEHRITSLFGRLNYAYMNKYLFTGILRRDGSTRFSSNNKYGVFPSFSLGWVISKESFLENSQAISYFKLRGGYGVVGNDAIPDFRYSSIVRGGNNYPFGTGAGQTIVIGYNPITLENPDLRWEQTSQANVGFETQLFKKFNATVDFYNKKTLGILRPINIPGFVGMQENPWANLADMTNKGVDIELGYSNAFGELTFSANGNVGFLKNEITKLDLDADFAAGDASFQSMGSVTRIQVGQPYNAFFGYKTDGIFQNQSEIDNYRNAQGELIQPNAQPGDFRWVDINGDGVITDDDNDKTFLGSSIPKLTYGLTLNFSYKGFDFMAFTQGAAGNKIFQGLRRLDLGNANFPERALDRWTGEGTSNTYAKLIKDDPRRNFSRMSDFYLEKGDYLRMKVMQLGYTLPPTLFGKTGISRLRVYLTAENLFTITGYTGYDPEVGGAVFGIDKGQYPQARSFIGGVQLQF